MKNFISKNLNYILLLAIALIFFIISLVPVVMFSAKPASYYQTGELGEEGYYNSLCYKIDLEDEKYTLNSIYINFGGLDYTEKNDGADTYLEIYTSFARSESTSFYNQSCLVGEDNFYDKIINDYKYVKAGDWQPLITNISYSAYQYFLLSTESKFKINELAFVGKNKAGDLVLLKAEAIGAGAKQRIKGVRSALSNSPEFDTTAAGIAEAALLIDEAHTFSVNNILENYSYYNDYSYADEENILFESVRNVASGRGNFIDLRVNPVGQYLISFFGAGFGQTVTGMRVIAMIYSLLTLVLLYFVALMMFNKKYLALILPFIYAIGGISLSFSTTASVVPIFAFFIMLSFYAAYKFYKKGVSNGKMMKDLSNVFLFGAAFAAAFSVKSQALYFAPFLVGIFVVGIIRQYRAYAVRKAAAEEKDLPKIKDNYVKKVTYTCASAVASAVLLTFLISLAGFVIASASYGIFTGKNGFESSIYCIGKSFTAYYKTTYSAISRTSPLGFIINYKATQLCANKFVFGNVLLLAVNLFAVIFGAAYSVIICVEQKKNYKAERKFNFFIPYIFSAVTAAGSLLMYLIGGAKTAEIFYLPFIFMAICTVAVINSFEIEKTGTLFRIKSYEVTVSRLITAILLIMATANFALCFAGLTGITINQSVYNWNFIKK